MAAAVLEYSISEFVNELQAELSWETPSKPDHPYVFWSLDDDQASSRIQEKIKSALCNLELDHRCVLIQFWAPVKVNTNGGQYFLTTFDQPFALLQIDKKICEYRKHMLSYNFSANGEREEGSIGPPGRVFRNKLPESTPDVQYCSTEEYPQRDLAVRCGIQESYYLPVFEFYSESCVGVLELLYTKGDFHPCYTDTLNEALEVQNLKLKHLFDNHQEETIHGWRSAKDELDLVLTKVHENYQLPLVQTWIPYRHGHLKSMLTKRLAVYVDDNDWFSISDAYDVHQLMKGNVLIDKTLLSHQPCFCEDISKLGIAEYPLVHYARYDELISCFVMCLRSTHTGNHDYVLEFFLPHGHGKTNREDTQILLESILKTMKQEFQSFKVSSGEQLGDELSVQVIKASMSDKHDTFQICQTTRSPSRPEVLQSESELVQQGSSAICQQSSSSTKSSVQLEHSFPPQSLGHAKFPTEEDGLIHFDKTCTKNTSETEQNQAEDDVVDGSFALQNGLSCVRADQNNTTITYSEKRYLKKASGTKKRTTELTISGEGHPKKIGRKPEDASDSLILSQSSGKRICLEPEIVRHTSPRRKMVNHSGSSPNLKQKNDIVKGGEKLTTDSSARDASFFDLPHKENAVPATHIIPNATPVSDSKTVTIKATYTENVMIKFQLSLSARVAELEEKVTKRLKLEEGSFKCKYKDNDGDLVLIACDEDLQNCIGSSSSLDKNIIRLLILPRINLAP